jgi:hypothetical protein
MKAHQKAANYMASADDTKKEALVQAFRRGAKFLHHQTVQAIVDQQPQESILSSMIIEAMADAAKIVEKRKLKLEKQKAKDLKHEKSVVAKNLKKSKVYKA